MLKKPLIVGSRGNMGKRYAAGFRYLGIEPLGIDVGDPIPDGFDSVVIATPTSNHLPQIVRFGKMGVPILCEKPFSTNLDEAIEICDYADEHKVDLRMVNQYAMLTFPRAAGETLYDYFRTGQDGLAWDCINIIGLAKEKVTLKNKSPLWRCEINGQRIPFAEMDFAYVQMLSQWTSGKYAAGSIEYAREAHAKVWAYLEVFE
jgi:hypothetical protein